MTIEEKIQSNLLRNALKGNGVFSTVSGISFLVMAKPIATFLGINSPWIIVAVGVSLLFFAVGLFRNAFSQNINRFEARLAITLDFLWVVGSAAAILLGVLSTGGNWGTAIIADIVLVFAILQTVGLRKLT